MSFLGNLAGNLLGSIIGKGVSSAMDLHSSKQLIDAQLQAQKDLFKYENTNKHQFEIGDLKAAGLNPILSATNPSAIGVGGVSAPNWSSDDDVFGPSAAKALEAKQLSIQDKQANAVALNAEAAMVQAHNNQVATSAKANLDNTQASIAQMKADLEVESLVHKIRETDANVNFLSGKLEEALASASEHRAGAKQKLEDALGKKLTNQEEKMLVDLINDPDMAGTATQHALVLAKGLKLPTSERVALVAAINGHKFRAKKDRINENANSATSAYDEQIKYMVD